MGDSCSVHSGADPADSSSNGLLDRERGMIARAESRSGKRWWGRWDLKLGLVVFFGHGHAIPSNVTCGLLTSRMALMLVAVGQNRGEYQDSSLRKFS